MFGGSDEKIIPSVSACCIHTQTYTKCVCTLFCRRQTMRSTHLQMHTLHERVKYYKYINIQQYMWFKTGKIKLSDMRIRFRFLCGFFSTKGVWIWDIEHTIMKTEFQLTEMMYIFASKLYHPWTTPLFTQTSHFTQFDFRYELSLPFIQFDDSSCTVWVYCERAAYYIWQKWIYGVYNVVCGLWNLCKCNQCTKCFYGTKIWHRSM